MCALVIAVALLTHGTPAYTPWIKVGSNAVRCLLFWKFTCSVRWCSASSLGMRIRRLISAAYAPWLLRFTKLSFISQTASGTLWKSVVSCVANATPSQNRPLWCARRTVLSSLISHIQKTLCLFSVCKNGASWRVADKCCSYSSIQGLEVWNENSYQKWGVLCFLFCPFFKMVATLI